MLSLKQAAEDLGYAWLELFPRRKDLIQQAKQSLNATKVLKPVRRKLQLHKLYFDRLVRLYEEVHSRDAVAKIDEEIRRRYELLTEIIRDPSKLRTAEEIRSVIPDDAAPFPIQAESYEELLIKTAEERRKRRDAAWREFQPRWRRCYERFTLLNLYNKAKPAINSYDDSFGLRRRLAHIVMRRLRVLAARDAARSQYATRTAIREEYDAAIRDINIAALRTVIR